MADLHTNSHFSKVPYDVMKRSRFSRNHEHKTTFNAGELIPIYTSEVLPGDTFDLKTQFVCRMTTPIFPVMDDAYIDFAYFFVPNRLVWDHWEEMNGENNESAWTQPVDYSCPTLSAPENGWDKGSIADYFGLPTNVSGIEVNHLPFRAYVKIWNDWWRDQNTMDPAYFVVDDNNRVGQVRGDTDVLGALNSALYGGRPLNAAKFHDYFTSALPQPQKGPAVNIDVNGRVPVITGDRFPLAGDPIAEYPALHGLNLQFGKNVLYSDAYGFIKEDSTDQSSTLSGTAFIPDNLWADSDAVAGLGSLAVTVNDLRMAVQIQRLFEKDARGGSRYIEVLKSHFGTISPDARLQRSEYLGGMRHSINMGQVLQTSSTNETSPQGNASGFSMTMGSNGSFVKSFTEHGWIIGLCVVRTAHTYQQGINRSFSRKRRFDYYWPALAHIGEQAILKKEIYADNYFGTGGPDDVDPNEEAFGYQEAWADYRYHPNIVSGAFRSNVNGSLDAWHYADYYEGGNDNFVLSPEFVFETSKNIDRTLAVNSELEDQFIIDYKAYVTATRVMPLYSVPGLVDHF